MIRITIETDEYLSMDALNDFAKEESGPISLFLGDILCARGRFGARQDPNREENGRTLVVYEFEKFPELKTRKKK